MIEDLREEEIVNKVGGRFKLSTLIQKRLVALNAGSRPLVDVATDDKMQIVIEEIKQDKIFLDTSLNLRITGESPEAGGPLDFDPTILCSVVRPASGCPCPGSRHARCCSTALIPADSRRETQSGQWMC
jgi:DNA-directed RNA polymerase subunit omega